MSVISHLVARKAHKSGWLNLREGFTLLRSREVPAGLKMLALALGLFVTIALEAFEVPLEAVIATLIPLLGGVIDLAFDGLEFIVLPLLLAAAILPHLNKRRANGT